GIVGDERLLAQGQLSYGFTLLKAGPVGMAGRLAEALRLMEAVVRLAEAAGGLEMLQRSVGNVAYYRAITGELAAGGGDRRRALTRAERRGDPMWICLYTAVHGWIAFLLGEWVQARAEIEQAVAMSRQVGVIWAAPYALLYQGQLCLAAGRWNEAARSL